MIFNTALIAFASVFAIAANAAPVSLEQRGFSGDGTFYNPSAGTGSCGWENSDSELVAALNAPQMANGANPNKNPKCGDRIRVKGPKGSVTVKIVDTCPPCQSGSVDLSPAAFNKIADFAQGRVPISWNWV
ncbi:hypothetical protein DFQ28_011502 [Apophysomyces sp. BC1034]|nr:hypothetical protein DFQ30_011157 [Apophysomyces sp. BC1015]KAG0181121.1 hypothetical protein DFQ29_009280 [Apophysomyces sp. BC1021]KAG0191589.1 hypothetical protein DFQ28_011502 [Apophysomyces sp. BC1034]